MIGGTGEDSRHSLSKVKEASTEAGLLPTIKNSKDFVNKNFQPMIGDKIEESSFP